MDLDTYPLRNFIRPRCAERAKRSRGKPVLIMHIIWLFSLFSRHISRTQSFQQNRHIIFPALVALNRLVSLMSRLVACSARIVADRQTNRQTDRQTHRTTTVTLAAHSRRGLIMCSSLFGNLPRLRIYSLVNQPVFFGLRMRARKGEGEGKEKTVWPNSPGF